MVDIIGQMIQKAFTGGEPVKAIYSDGVRVWPVIDYFGGLTFTALEDITVSVNHNGTNQTTTKPNIQYSLNGRNWEDFDDDVTVKKGNIVYLKGINDSFSNTVDNFSTFGVTGDSVVSGNIMSLLYGSDFEGKTDLSNKNYCFYKLFMNNSDITSSSGLLLPATTLADSQSVYSYMFWNCDSMTDAPELPATTLSRYAYHHTFDGCSSLLVAPELPTVELGYDYVYSYMFANCISLVKSPYLPATTLTNRCYQYMFQNCSNLNYVEADFLDMPSTTYTNNWLSNVSITGTFVPNEDATWVDDFERGVSTVPFEWNIKRDEPVEFDGLSFYFVEANRLSMEHNGTNQTTTKPDIQYSVDLKNWYELPDDGVYFENNTAVYLKGNNPTGVSHSPVNYSRFVTLGEGRRFSADGNIMSLLYGDNYAGETDLTGKTYCFYGLFRGNTDITSAPYLPATTLENYCYYSMFSRCTQLTGEIWLPATELKFGCYQELFDGCSNVNWVKAYFLDSPSNAFTSYWMNGVSATGNFESNPNATWINDFTRGIHTVPVRWAINGVEPAKYEGLMFTAVDGPITVGITHYGTNKTTTKPDIQYSINDGSTWNTLTSNVTLQSGQTMCLKGNNTQISRSSSNYSTFTTSGSGKMQASGNLMSLTNYSRAESLGVYCFAYLFKNNTYLTTPPELTGRDETEYLQKNFYQQTFYGCSNLQYTPKLPGRTAGLNQYCYNGMFRRCSSLTEIPELPSGNINNDNCKYAMQYMFAECTNITSVNLPATGITTGTYAHMFEGCSKLNDVTCKLSTATGTGQFISWLSNVSSTGTFHKLGTYNFPTDSTSGIPSGWTVVTN